MTKVIGALVVGTGLLLTGSLLGSIGDPWSGFHGIGALITGIGFWVYYAIVAIRNSRIVVVITIRSRNSLRHYISPSCGIRAGKVRGICSGLRV